MAGPTTTRQRQVPRAVGFVSTLRAFLPKRLRSVSKPFMPTHQKHAARDDATTTHPAAHPSQRNQNPTHTTPHARPNSSQQRPHRREARHVLRGHARARLLVAREHLVHDRRGALLHLAARELARRVARLDGRQLGVVLQEVLQVLDRHVRLEVGPQPPVVGERAVAARAAEGGVHLLAHLLGRVGQVNRAAARARRRHLRVQAGERRQELVVHDRRLGLAEAARDVAHDPEVRPRRERRRHLHRRVHELPERVGRLAALGVHAHAKRLCELADSQPALDLADHRVERADGVRVLEDERAVGVEAARDDVDDVLGGECARLFERQALEEKLFV
eukprot:3846215-Prymnesium_polylepis.1